MGSSDSINFSLSNLYRSWYMFRHGKRNSSEILAFQYSLESNIDQLQHSLANRTYKHGLYSTFIVEDSKRREISVAPVKDRIVHRLVYDYLSSIWDKHFIYDAWSCRPAKGQHKAVTRASDYMQRYANGWVWQADVSKFFDSVSQAELISFIKRRVNCPDALWLIEEILSSYYKKDPGVGMPIGNLTSQIFANIYFNEFDRYMVHSLKPRAYLRYGDDWVCFSDQLPHLQLIKKEATCFLYEELKLGLSPRLNKLQPVHKGITYLGIDMWPDGQRITLKTQARIYERLNNSNFASYESLHRNFSNARNLKQFYWETLDPGLY